MTLPIKTKENNFMTVKELKELLQGVSDDTVLYVKIGRDERGSLCSPILSCLSPVRKPKKAPNTLIFIHRDAQ